MASDNYAQLIQLAEEVFAVKNDPSQLDVNQEVIKQLQRIHSATVSEYRDEHGPAAWVLVIPTTLELMNRFLSCAISEKELFDLTPTGVKYKALYLCSALVLEEYRRKGIAKDLALKAINEIRKEHPLKAIFVWPFSKEGNIAAKSVARLASLPWLKRQTRSASAMKKKNKTRLR